MAAPDKRCTFDFVPEGDLVDGNNTAGSGNAITAPVVAGVGEARAYAAQTIRGFKGVRVTGDASSTYGIGLSFAPSGSASSQVYFMADSANRPTGVSPWTVIRLRNASANTCSIVMNSAGVVSVQNATGTGIHNFNSGAALADGNYYVNLRAVKGTTTSNGRILATLRNAANDTLVGASYDSGSTVNAGVDDFTQAQTGKPTANQVLTGSVVDDFAVLSGSTAEIDPVSATQTGAWQRQTFNNGAQGVTITSANSLSSGDQLAQVLVAGTGDGVYDSAAAARGARGARVTGILNDTFSMLLTDTAAASASVQVYFKMNALPTAVAECFGIRSASANVARFVVNTSGVLSIQNASGVGLKNFLSNTPISIGTWYRLQLQATKGTTTSDGYIAGQLYSNNDSLLDSYTSNVVNAGTADMTTVRAGKVTAGSDGFTMDFDELALVTGTTLEIDPVPGAGSPPIANAGASIENVEPWTTVTLDGSNSTSSGTITNYSWSQTSGNAVSLQGSGAVRTFIAPATATDATLSFQLVVTDSLAQSANDTIDVTILRATEYVAQGGAWVPLGSQSV